MANTSVTINIETNLDEVIEKTEKLIVLLDKLQGHDGILLNAGNITVNGSVTIHDGGDSGEDMKLIYKVSEPDKPVFTNHMFMQKLDRLQTQFETWNRHESTDKNGNPLFAK